LYFFSGRPPIDSKNDLDTIEEKQTEKSKESCQKTNERKEINAIQKQTQETNCET